MKKVIIVPVYLRAGRPEDISESEAVLLAQRAIRSLKVLRDQDFTLILPLCLDRGSEGGEDILFHMDQRARDVFKAWVPRDTLLFSSFQLKGLKAYLNRRNFTEVSSHVGLYGFSNIRNVGLLLAQSLAADVAVFLDYDEVVEDPDYLSRACDYLDQFWDGKRVNGKGGFYLNPDGTILHPPQRLWWRRLWNKAKWMNRVWETLLASEDRLVFSPTLLGGNLVLHKDLFQALPFDPFIPRGEDTDYLINAIHSDFPLLFDKALRVKHLHPERTETFYHEELRGDIERFLYEREKIRRTGEVHLDPYPGHFLTWTLYPRAAATSLLLAVDYLIRRRWTQARMSVTNLTLLFKKRPEAGMAYLRFKREWGRVMEAIEREGLGDLLEACGS